MPGFDGTGPRGAGPMTGGGRGLCAYPAYGMQPFYGANYGMPARSLRSVGFGRSMGMGRGRGMGMGRRMAHPHTAYAPNPYFSPNAPYYSPYPRGW